jgi:CxxC motif-containing protein
MQESNINEDWPLCACGCGLRVDKRHKIYYGDHYRRSKKYKKDRKYKSQDYKNIFLKNIEPKKSETQTKKSTGVKKTTPIPGGKISKENLLNCGLGMYIC